MHRSCLTGHLSNPQPQQPASAARLQLSELSRQHCPVKQPLPRTFHLDRLACLQDDACVLTASGDETVRLWDAGRAAAVGVFAGHSGSVKSVATQPSCQQVIASGEGL